MINMNSLGRICGNGQKLANRDSSSAYMTSQDAKDYDVWSSAWRNTNHRCSYFTLLYSNPSGNWRVVAVPFHCLNVRTLAGSGSQLFTDGTVSGQKAQYYSRSKALTNKVTRGDALPGKSSGCTSFNSDDFNVTNLSDIHNGASKVGKPGKKNNTKKLKRKGKSDRKLALESGKIDAACVDGSATDDRCSSKNTHPETSPISWETPSTVLSPDSCSNSSEDNCSGSTNYSEILEANTPNTNLVDILEAKCGARSAIPDLSALKRVQDSLYESVGCVKDSGSSVLSEASNPLVLGSISVSSKSDDVAISSRSSEDVRLRVIREVPRNSCVSKESSLRNFDGLSAENSGLAKVDSIDCQGVNNLKIVSFLERSHNVSQSKILSNGEDKNQSRVKNAGNLRRKSRAGSKQELNCHSTKLFYTSKSTSYLYTKIGTELNNAVDISPHLGPEKGLVGISRPLSKVDYTRSESEAEKVDPNACGHAYQLEGRSNRVQSLEEIYLLSSCSLNGQTVREECKSIPPHFEDSNQTERLNGQSTVFFNPTGTEGLGRGKDVSAVEQNKRDQVSGRSINKWIPSGIKDSELAKSDLSNSSRCVDKVAAESTSIEGASSEAFHCSMNSIKEWFEKGSKANNAQRSDAKVPIGNFSFETAVSNDSHMILQAANDAYKAQLTSEAVEKAIGCPVVELERFLHAASPVIPLCNKISRCLTCLPDEVSLTPLCRDKIPNLSLGNMWQWYEKHGTFGLEVKAEDFDNSKRLGVDRIVFRAYFVPFLSAVQLFRPCRSYSSHTSRTIPDTDVACDLVANSSSNRGVKIFSVLVPQPKTMDNVANDSTSSDELELVYEYFEAERPQQRRPLYEMIKDLVSSSELLQGSAFGDPSKLVSMAVNDLHPKSWYSVAWYPIYRIPDEKFHSAFLTYHSFGHLVHGSASSDSFAGNACVVSPVVGLQSYNTQGECWLKPRNLPKEIPNYNHCEILKERLRTLEHTASVMARAEVVKGNVKSVNRQPDYEFFLSRRSR